MQLRQAVNELIQPLRGGVRLPVPLLINGRVFQAEISRKVDDLGRQFGVMVDLRLHLPMRQGQEQDIDGFYLGGITEFQAGAFA